MLEWPLGVSRSWGWPLEAGSNFELLKETSSWQLARSQGPQFYIHRKWILSVSQKSLAVAPLTLCVRAERQTAVWLQSLQGPRYACPDHCPRQIKMNMCCFRSINLWFGTQYREQTPFPMVCSSLSLRRISLHDGPHFIYPIPSWWTLELSPDWDCHG
jgi:hypothetical protein